MPAHWHGTHQYTMQSISEMARIAGTRGQFVPVTDVFSPEIPNRVRGHVDKLASDEHNCRQPTTAARGRRYPFFAVDAKYRLTFDRIKTYYEIDFTQIEIGFIST